jgi:hypothetical protein
MILMDQIERSNSFGYEDNFRKIDSIMKLANEAAGVCVA